jgi:AP endonuclease-2
VDLTADDEEPPKKVEKVENIERKETKGKAKAPPKPAPKAPKSKDGQATLAAFWTSKAKPEVASPKAASPKAEEPSPMEIEDPDTEADAALARALAAADAEEDAARQRARSEKQEQAAPVWSSLFARKLPPLCTMHQKPCKDFSACVTPVLADSSRQDPRTQQGQAVLAVFSVSRVIVY